jgi:hypothetical protein
MRDYLFRFALVNRTLGGSFSKKGRVSSYVSKLLIADICDFEAVRDG